MPRRLSETHSHFPERLFGVALVGPAAFEPPAELTREFQRRVDSLRAARDAKARAGSIRPLTKTEIAAVLDLRPLSSGICPFPPHSTTEEP